MMQSRVEAMRVRREQIGNQCQRRLLVAGRLNADHLGSMHFLGRRPLQAGSGGEWLMTDGVSRYFIRSIEGLRVAIAGFPNAAKVEVEEGVALNVSTLGELRAESGVGVSVVAQAITRSYGDRVVLDRVVGRDAAGRPCGRTEANHLP